MSGAHTVPCIKWICRSWSGQWKSAECSCHFTGNLMRVKSALLSWSCLLEWKRLSIFTGFSSRSCWLELRKTASVQKLGNKNKVGREFWEGNIPCCCFLLVQWVNKPQVPTAVSLALFARTGILSNTDDVGSIKSLLRIAVQRGLWAFCNIYLWDSHFLSIEVTQTGTLLNTTLFWKAKLKFKLDFGYIKRMYQMNSDYENFLAVLKVG